MFCFDKSNNSMIVNARFEPTSWQKRVWKTHADGYRKRPSVTRSVRQEWTWWSDWPCLFVVELWRVTRQQTLRQRRQRQQRYTHAHAGGHRYTHRVTDGHRYKHNHTVTDRQKHGQTDRYRQTVGVREKIGWEVFSCKRPGSYVWLSWYRRQFISGRKVHDPWTGTKGATNSVIRTTAFMARL